MENKLKPYKRYKQLERQLTRLRNKPEFFKKFESEAELDKKSDILLDEMDVIWRILTSEERAKISEAAVWDTIRKDEPVWGRPLIIISAIFSIVGLIWIYLW